MKKKTKNLIYTIPFLSCLLCACSGKNFVELNTHELVLEPGESYKFEIRKNDKKGLSFGTNINDIIDIDSSNQTITAKREGRTTLSVNQNNVVDTCDVAVRYSNIQPTNPLNVATIAHKGYHLNAIENTYEAFSEAGRRNFYGVETDIHMTKDKVWICNHDSKVKGMSKNISDCTLEEILEVNLSDDPNKVVNVCTFEDYLNICNAYNKHPVIEFKEETPKQYLEEVINILSFYSVLDGVIFISKLGNVLGTLINIKNENEFKYDLQMLTEGNGWQYVSEFLNVSSQYEAITDSMISDCNSMGQYVAAWTVNDREEAESLISLGVKYITTDVFECTDEFIDKTLFGI